VLTMMLSTRRTITSPQTIVHKNGKRTKALVVGNPSPGL
jgi:hypothetical protein